MAYQQQHTDDLLAWINTRVDTADQQEQNIESMKADLKEASQDAAHTTRRKRLIAALVNWKSNALRLFVTLFLIQIVGRVWLLSVGSTHAIAPYNTIAGGTFGGGFTFADPLRVAALFVLTVATAAGVGLIVSILIAGLVHGKQAITHQQTVAVPAAPEGHGVMAIYQSVPDADPQLWLQGRGRWVASSEHGYANTTEQRSDTDAAQPDPVTHETTPSSPQLIVKEWIQPDRLRTTSDVSLADKRCLERLIEAANEISCPCEAQVIISSGTQTYEVPTDAGADTNLIDGISARLKEYGRYDDHERTQYLVNIRLVTAPRTDQEFFDTRESLSAVGLNLPNTPQVAGSIETLSPTYRDPRQNQSRFPRLLRARQKVTQQFGSRPGRQSATSQGLLSWIHCWIGRVADPDSGVSLETAVRERRFRTTRDTGRIKSKQTDLIVSQDALASLLIARRDYNTALEAALPDASGGEPLTEANTADFLADTNTSDEGTGDARTDGGDQEQTPDAASETAGETETTDDDKPGEDS